MPPALARGVAAGEPFPIAVSGGAPPGACPLAWPPSNAHNTQVP